MPLDTNATIGGVNANNNVQMQVDPTFQSARANLRPTEFVGSGMIGGHFYMAATFSNTAGQPNSASAQLFSMRWADTRTLFVLKRVTVTATITTAFGAAQLVDYDIIKAVSFSTNPSGGSSITLATTSQKARSNTMSGSLLATSGALQISSGSALTAGTQTLDTQPFGYVMSAVQTAATAAFSVVTPSYQSLFETRDFGQHPMVFSANEGFVVRNGTAYGATGVVKAGFMVEWCEVPTY